MPHYYFSWDIWTSHRLWTRFCRVCSFVHIKSVERFMWVIYAQLSICFCTCNEVIVCVSASDIFMKNGPLARYVNSRVAHAPGMLETYSPPPWASDLDMHHDTCVTHVPWCMSGSLTSGFLWCWWRGKRCRHSRRMRNPQFYVSGKRPMRILLCPTSQIMCT